MPNNTQNQNNSTNKKEASPWAESSTVDSIKPKATTPTEPENSSPENTPAVEPNQAPLQQEQPTENEQPEETTEPQTEVTPTIVEQPESVEESEAEEELEEEPEYEEPKPKKKKKKRRAGKMKFFDGLNIIVIGLLLLANTLEIVGWGVWGKMVILFARFWPVFIILWGFSLILRFSFVTRFLGKVLGFLVFLLFIGTAVYWQEQSKADDWLGTKVPLFHDYIVSRDIVEKDIVYNEKDYDQNFEKRVLDFELTAGEMNVETNNDSSDYLKLDAEYFEKFGEPRIKDNIDGDTLNLKFDPYFKPNVFNLFNRKLTYDFEVGETDLLTDIKVDMKAGKCDLKIDDLNLNDFDAKIKAGSVDVEFTEKSLPKTMFIELKAGSYKITMPKNVRLNVEYDITAGSLDIKNENIGWGDGKYTHNPSGEHVIDLNVNVKAGSVKFYFE